jgi:hypothetical protein
MESLSLKLQGKANFLAGSVNHNLIIFLPVRTMVALLTSIVGLFSGEFGSCLPLEKIL